MISGLSTSNGFSPPPVFVTGAAGHVGANLVLRLLEDGVRVRVLLRHGDIRDLDDTRRVLEGCRGVYHVAAMISTIEGNHAYRCNIYECNVLGTCHVLQAAREAGAGQVVVTGSFSAVGYDLDNPSLPSDETMQLLCMVHGRAGEKYISSSEYKTISEILDLYEEVTGISRPGRRIPTHMMLAFSEVASFYLSCFHPSFPQYFTPSAIRLLKKCRHADTGKAKRELGYRPTSILDAVHQAYAFHYHRGAIQNPLANPPHEEALRAVQHPVSGEDVSIASEGGPL